MNKLKEIKVVTIIVITLTLLPTTYCQFSESSTALDIITEGVKAMFGLEQMLKTYRKVSSGVIPFPFFVPILPKSKVIELLKGKKSKKEKKSQPLSESSSKLSPISVSPPKLRHNYKQYNQFPVYNMRPTNIGSEYPFLVINGLTAQPPIVEDIKSNALDFDYMQNNDMSNTYAERFESGIPQDLEEDTIEDHNVPTHLELIQNWGTIDDELRRIGYRLGKLGQILHKN